jgi:hypothetical protein
LSKSDCYKRAFEKLDWRQELLALAKITNDTQSSYEDIKNEQIPKHRYLNGQL